MQGTRRLLSMSFGSSAYLVYIHKNSFLHPCNKRTASHSPQSSLDKGVDTNAHVCGLAISIICHFSHSGQNH